jgi:hypothetical protein
MTRIKFSVIEPARSTTHVGRVQQDSATGPRGGAFAVHISGEHGHGWTTLAIDRKTREWSIAQRHAQSEAAQAAYGNLYISRE